MDKLYELKDKLCQELDEMAEKPLNPQNLDLIHKLASAAKNVDKIIMMKEDGYSGRSYRGGSYRGGSYDDGGSYGEGGSYARGRRNAPRDSMGRYSGDGYSRHGDMAEELRGLMADAPEHVKKDMQRLLDKLEDGR